MARRLRILLFACMLVLGMSAVPAGASHSSAGDSGSATSAAAGPTKLSKKCKKLKKKAKKSKKAKKKYKKKCKKKSGGGGTGGGGGGGGTGGGGGGGGTTACPAYVPGEDGAGAETSIVTDAATEAAPLEVTVPTEAAIGGEPAATATVYRNIQVDTAAASTGLWVRFEMETGEDYDITLLNADGSEAASAGGYNPAPVIPGRTDGTGSGGHSEQTAEQLDGVATADCGGYTLDMSSFQTPGGDKTLKLWLGAANCTPPCGGPAE